MIVCAMVIKEELLRLWAQSRMVGQEARRRVILIGGDREMSRLDEALKQNAQGEISVAARLDPGQFSISVLRIYCIRMLPMPFWWHPSSSFWSD